MEIERTRQINEKNESFCVEVQVATRWMSPAELVDARLLLASRLADLGGGHVHRRRSRQA